MSLTLEQGPETQAPGELVAWAVRLTEALLGAPVGRVTCSA